MGVLALVGGQYGSEGKGVIANHIADDVTVAVRVGGPNAGHSLQHEGRVWKMRSVPCAWTNPKALLVIGAGAVLDSLELVKEVDALEAAGYRIRERLMVDQAATIILPDDLHAERHATPGGPGALTDTIASTGEGVGAARIRRIKRQPEIWQSAEEALAPARISVVDTVPILNLLARSGVCLLEGTQGFGLSITYGHWPYVTSRDCTAAQLVADTGIGAPFESIVVFRSHPIRVGGNSGPLAGELTWEDISSRFGRDIIERTTVTNKVRRIGAWDWGLAARACVINRPIGVALTFADYIDPSVEGATSWSQLTTPVRSFIDAIEDKLSVPVVFVGTGGPHWSVIDRQTGDRRDSRRG